MNDGKQNETDCKQQDPNRVDEGNQSANDDEVDQLEQRVDTVLRDRDGHVGRTREEDPIEEGHDHGGLQDHAVRLPANLDPPRTGNGAGVVGGVLLDGDIRDECRVEEEEELDHVGPVREEKEVLLLRLLLLGVRDDDAFCLKLLVDPRLVHNHHNADDELRDEIEDHSERQEGISGKKACVVPSPHRRPMIVVGASLPLVRR
mmetsp:Transcript_36021/g.84306  ORF Transcript_36021/g.84306 Transcript_36021/m.84306 type:complete len:203 (+) Transcript_36021:613-1221(+)